VSARNELDLYRTKRASKNKEEFGQGSIECLMPRTGDNACVPARIPVLRSPVPAGAGAVLLAAMLIHGVRPAR